MTSWWWLILSCVRGGEILNSLSSWDTQLMGGYDGSSQLIEYSCPDLCYLAHAPVSEICLIGSRYSQLAVSWHFLDSCSLADSPVNQICALQEWRHQQLVLYRSPYVCSLLESPFIAMCPLQTMSPQLMEFRIPIGCFIEMCLVREKGALCLLQCRMKECLNDCLCMDNFAGIYLLRHLRFGDEMCCLRPAGKEGSCRSGAKTCRPTPADKEGLCSRRNQIWDDICPLMRENSAGEMCSLRSPNMEGMCPVRSENWNKMCSLRSDVSVEEMCPISPAADIEGMCPVRSEIEVEKCPLKNKDSAGLTCPREPLDEEQMCHLRPEDMEGMCPVRIENWRHFGLVGTVEDWLGETFPLKCPLADKPRICLARGTSSMPFNSSFQCALTDRPEYEPNLICQGQVTHRPLYQPEVFGGTVLLVTALVLLYLYAKRQNKKRMPPGPFSWPIVGHFYLLGSLPHQYLFHLSERYGSLMYLRLGSVPTIVISSSTMAMEFLKNQDMIFASRPLTAAGQYVGYNNKCLVWMPSGSHWQQMRKVYMELLNQKRLESFCHLRTEEINVAIHSIWEALYDEEEQVDVSMKLSAMINNIFSQFVLGKKYYGKGTEGRLEPFEYKLLMDELFYLDRIFNVGDYIPYLRWLDLQGYEQRMKKVSKRLDMFLEEIIEEHCHPSSRGKNQEDVYVINALLSISQNNPSYQAELNRDNIKAIILDFLLGGISTTAATIEWAMSELLRNPKVMIKAQGELDDLVGKGRRLEDSDLPQLQYLQAVVKETLRLHPVCPLAIPHQSTAPCKVDDYYIPKEARLFVNLWAMGRDVTAWIKPLEFFPERFLIESKIDVQGQHFQLVPFGSGSRACPGLPLALSVVHFAIASFIHCFNWSLPLKQNPENLDMEESLELACSRRVPLIAVPRARLRPYLF